MRWTARDDRLIIADRAFVSRLLVGTGKFSSGAAMVSALERTSGCEIVTPVALRRIDINKQDDSTPLAHRSQQVPVVAEYQRRAELQMKQSGWLDSARAAGCDPWIKLEVTPDPYTLMPDPIETLKAAEILVKEGFTGYFLTSMPNPILAKRLQEAGTATVMPLGAPIGTNRGVPHQGPDRDHHRAGHRSRYRGRRDWSSVPCCGGNGDGSRRRPG